MAVYAIINKRSTKESLAEFHAEDALGDAGGSGLLGPFCHLRASKHNPRLLGAKGPGCVLCDPNGECIDRTN